MERVIKKLLLLLSLTYALTLNADDFVNGDKNVDRIIFNGMHIPRLIEVEPEGWYCYETRMLTIEFPTTGFEPYTLTVETMLTTQEYYVTTPFVSQYISPDVVNVNLYLETDGGDLYWGSFQATSTGSMD